ncbi:MAG TPA: YdeI/OmpD-associated family protein [Thermoanaerobaculia bacterium]|jgi:hypothetical protein|nr:YdeI/OmpD-associated family protein [Thermoanaerobaculia bacterium]
MATLRFMATIDIHGVNPFVPVSAARAAKIKRDWRQPMPVVVRINGKPEEPWHINMMPAGDGAFRLYLHGDVRKASATRVGDRVNVEVGFDAAYRSGPQPLPPWFRAALAKDPIAEQNWQALPPSRQKEIVRYLAALKSAAARERNLARALQALAGKPGRFMARSWSEGK